MEIIVCGERGMKTVRMTIVKSWKKVGQVGDGIRYFLFLSHVGYQLSYIGLKGLYSGKMGLEHEKHPCKQSYGKKIRGGGKGGGDMSTFFTFFVTINSILPCVFETADIKYPCLFVLLKRMQLLC